MLNWIVELMIMRLIYIIIFIVSLSSCSIYNSNEDRRFSVISDGLEIGIDVSVAQKLSQKYTGEQLNKFFIYYQELVNICNMSGKHCFPDNLHNIVKVKKGGDITVDTPAVGLYRHEKLSVAEYIGVFYSQKSGKIIGWLHFY